MKKLVLTLVLLTLSTTGKIDAEDAAALIAGVNDAILCVQTLG